MFKITPPVIFELLILMAIFPAWVMIPCAETVNVETLDALPYVPAIAPLAVRLDTRKMSEASRAGYWVDAFASIN